VIRNSIPIGRYFEPSRNSATTRNDFGDSGALKNILWPVSYTFRLASIIPQALRAAAAPSDEGPITILTSTLASVRIPDTACANTLVPSMVSHPEKRPTVAVVLHFGRRVRSFAGVGFTGAVGRSMVTVVLMINGEDGESLGLGGSGVVTAFCCLNR
jgi:hypothetical protein